jgi:hypothetical protein
MIISEVFSLTGRGVSNMLPVKLTFLIGLEVFQIDHEN